MTQMTIAAAAISYADIAFFALIVIGLIIGIVGGTAKAARGIILSFTIILLSLLLVGFTIDSVKGLSFVQSMDDKIVESSSSWGEVFSEEVHVSDEGDFYVIADIDGTPTQVFIKDAAEEGGVSKIKAKFALWIAERFIDPAEEGQTLGRAVGDFVTSLVVALVTFIIFCIVLGIIFAILRKISKRMHESDHNALRIADRTIGAIIGAALMVMSVLFIMAILHIFREKIAVVDDYLTNSPVCGFLYGNNPLTKVFGKIFG